MRAALILGLFLIACDSNAGAPPAAAPSPAPAPAPAQEVIGDRIAYAKQLLAEAGYPGGKGLEKLEVLYNTDEGHKKIAAAIQQMWNKNLGVNVELRNAEWKVYLDDLSKLRYTIARRGWIGDYRDPFTFIELMKSTSMNNNTGWKNDEFDNLVRDSGNEPDAAKRYEILRKAEALLLRDVPVIPLYYYVSQAAWTDKVKGVYQNIIDYHPLNEAYVEGRDTIIINNSTEIQSLDPALARGVPEHRVLNALFEGLTRNDPKTYDPRPGVAEKWDVSADGKTYTFQLRDCSWTDGKKVTAHDFAYGWRRILDPAFPSDYAHQLHVIKGAEAYNSRKNPDPMTVAANAKDDRTFVVELEHPVPYFPELITHYAFHPLRKDVIEKHKENWTRTENFVSNGPFKLKEWARHDYLLAEKSETYWEAAKTRTKFVKWLPIDNRLTAWNLYLDGKCDWVTTLPVEKMDQIVKRPDYRGETYLGIYYWSFNCTEGPLKDRRVRKALALAIDRDIIVKHIARQGQVPAYGFVPPMFDAYKSPRFDVKD
ncbi:MAG TPA: ABC transporter substrate-binding protein [Planctomycetota bacterium]|nr:ABC transporter substrate-binding protein [Planctomycetota bacterium]